MKFFFFRFIVFSQNLSERYGRCSAKDMSKYQSVIISVYLSLIKIEAQSYDFNQIETCFIYFNGGKTNECSRPKL